MHLSVFFRPCRCRKQLGKLVLLLGLVIFWLVACVPTPKETFPKVHSWTPVPAIIYIDHQFTTEQTQNIIKGIQNLECSTGYYFRFEVFTDTVLSELPLGYLNEHSILVRKVDDTNTDIIASDQRIEKGLLTYGLCITYIERPVEILMVATRLQPIHYTPVMTHELIHSLGISTHTKAKSIMSAVINQGADTLNETDFNLLCAYYDCDPKTFKTCY